MKFRLPKMILLAVLAGASVYSADEYTGHTDGYFMVKEENTISVGTGSSEISDADYATLVKGQLTDSYVNPLPIVKDGDGTLEINDKENVVIVNPLVVREGTLSLSNSSISSTLNKPSNFVPYLTVGGKNASLVLDNSSISHKYVTGASATSPVASFTIGSADGSGSLTLTNGSTLHTDHYIQGGDPDGQTNGSGGIGTGYVKATEDLVDGTWTKYSDGTFASDYHAKVTIEGGSTLSAGTSLQFADIYVKITGEGSLLTDNQRGLATSINYCSYLARESSFDGPIETRIDIEKGASFVSNWNLMTGAKVRANGNPETAVNITVGSDAEEGKTSVFKVKGHFDMGGALGSSASSNTNVTLTVKDGAEAYLNLVTVGNEGKGKLVVEDGGTIYQVAAEERYQYQPTENEFSQKDTPHMLINETGVVENCGIIELDITVAGGTYLGDGGADQFGGNVFTMLDGAVVKGLTMTSGTVNISGEVSLTKVTFGTAEVQSVAVYSLRTLSDANDALTINISDGATINADEVVIDENTIINMVLAEDSTSGAVTITGTDAEKISALKEQLESMNTVDGNGVAIEGGSFNVNTTVVPEPTTATLSLLALVGLAARRRRK